MFVGLKIVGMLWIIYIFCLLFSFYFGVRDLHIHYVFFNQVLSICNDIMDDAIPDMRANRDFRAKFPDDVLHESLAGQLWFGAEVNILYE